MALTRNKMASQHDFAMVPRNDVPRSRYMLQQSRKQTFDAGLLVPIYCEEILPGDHFKGSATIFARLATPITPVLDNASLETFFFFVPNRIVWEHWEEFIAGGNYVVPKIPSPVGGFAQGGIYDQLGIPTSGQIDPAGQIHINALPLRAYNKIFNEWFRDQNMVTPLVEETDDGPDSASDYALVNRAKKHDYFTSALPWPQKGTAVSIPLGNSAVVRTDANDILTGAQEPLRWNLIGGATATAGRAIATYTSGTNGETSVADASQFTTSAPQQIYPSNLFADLSTATSVTINALRTSFQIQRMLEKDARGGSRYIEQLESHFGVRPPDFRLQRPEYIGGGRTTINTHPIAQTSESNDTPQGNLAAFTTAQGGGNRFSYAATEHGYIIGLCNVRTDLTYQQGLRKHWFRETRYDYYFPSLAHLGEQAVTMKEIYAKGTTLNDSAIFGYQERWAEMRYTPNELTGLFRSYATGTIDVWHYGEEFATQPGLNASFIADPSKATLARSLAVGEEANGQQILLDVLFRVSATRPMPTYSVPGLIDHF